MHILDISSDVLVRVRSGLEIRRQVAGSHRDLPSVVDVDPIRRCCRLLMSINCCVTRRDDRPRACVGCRFADEITVFEFFECSIDVINVKCDNSCDPFVSIDFDDLQDIVLDRTGIAPRGANTRQSETVPAGRLDVHHLYREAESAAACNSWIPALRPCRTPPFTTRRRSSINSSSATRPLSAPQSWAPKYSHMRSYT